MPGAALIPTVRLRSPAQLTAASFAVAIAAGAVLLAMPYATEGPQRAPLLVALFTATSAVCVTGHIVVDTPTYWSTGGELTILLLIQLGGIGFMTLVVAFTLFFETLAAVVLTLRLWLSYEETLGRATYLGGCSTGSRPSTTPASRCTATTSSAS